MTVIRTTRALVVGAAIAVAATAVGIVGPAVAAAPHSVAAPNATKAPVTAGSYYLALGDSVPFGYREAANTPTPNYTKATNFAGYPEIVGQALSLKVVNASCPGETSSSFLNPAAQSNGCEASAAGVKQAGYRTNFPLHQKYSGSQLAYAVSFLKAHTKTTKLVTLQLGANDGFICQATTPGHCTQPSEIGPVVAKIEKNVGAIVKALRATGYKGQLQVVNYYSTDYTNTQLGAITTLGVTAINNGLDTGARPNNNVYVVHVSSPFYAFKTATAQTAGNLCTAGLLTILKNASTPCGVHPSVAGQYVIASKVIQDIAK